MAENCAPVPRKRGSGRPFQKGPDARRNAGGRSSEDIAAERDKQSAARASADEIMPDGRTAFRAVFDSVRDQAIGGSAPHAKLWLSYVIGEPEQNVNLNQPLVRIAFPPKTDAND